MSRGIDQRGTKFLFCQTVAYDILIKKTPEEYYVLSKYNIPVHGINKQTPRANSLLAVSQHSNKANLENNEVIPTDNEVEGKSIHYSDC